MNGKLLTTAVAGLAALGVCAARALPAEPPDLPERQAVREAEARREEMSRPDGGGPDGLRPLEVNLFAGAQYDDNATLRSMKVDAPQDDRTDWKSILALGLDFRPLPGPEDVLGLRYNAYQSFLDVNDQLQLSGHTVTGYYASVRAPVVVYVPASASRYDLESDHYLEIYALSPALFVEQNRHCVGVLRAAYQRCNYHQIFGDDFDENVRDADVLEVGAEEWFLFGSEAQYRLELGYTFRREKAREPEWSCHSNTLRAGLSAALPWGELSAGAFGAYEARDYDSFNEAFGRTEEDDVATAGATLSRPLWSGASVTLGYLFTDHASNEPSQDYRRNQVTLGVGVRF